MPSVLTLSHISYAYPGTPSSALKNVSASFPTGWTGVIGPNGCGKTTLARIACGELEPDAGSVTPACAGVYCPQDPSVEPSALFDFACDYAPEASRLRRSLGIEDDMLWRFSELSFGEQKKIQVAVSLWMRPDVLAIDEPTNHVDALCRKEIGRAMLEYAGIGILVSHDRMLLDAVATQVLSFEESRIVIRPGGYSQAREQEERERIEAVHRQETARAQVHKLEAEQRRRRERADKSSGMRSKRNLDKHDSDGRARIGLAIVSGQDGKAGKLASRMDARVESARADADAAWVNKRYEGDLWLDATPSKRDVVLELEECTIPCGPGRTLHVPGLYVGSTDHIGISGPNGAGKSTLIRRLLQESKHAGNLWCQVNGIQTLYLGQEIDAKGSQRFLGRIDKLSDEEKGLVLKGMSRLGSDPKRVLAMDAASPGELRKLAIVHGMLMSPQLIVLDEPTNHLDVQSTEALERALSDFPGALVLVSHDEMFLEQCTSKRWVVECTSEGSEVRCR